MKGTGATTAAASGGRSAIGIVVVATRACAVFAFGEAGICCERPTGLGGEPELAGYAFANVGRLWED